MRKCTRYSAEFKEQLLAKVFSPNAPSAIELARNANIPYPTLTTWIFKSKRLKTGGNSMSSKDKTAEGKLQAVFDTLKMTEEERGAYCRKNGLYTHHLEEWKNQILTGLEPARSKEERKEYRELKDKCKQLEHELNRKEKALAEASALLILKKKANLIWGGNEDD